MKGVSIKGAGRPTGTTKQNNRQSITIRLPPELIKLLEPIANKSRFIEELIKNELTPR